MDGSGDSQQYAYPGSEAPPQDYQVWGGRIGRDGDHPYYDLNRNGLQRREASPQPHEAPDTAVGSTDERGRAGDRRQDWRERGYGGGYSSPVPAPRYETPVGRNGYDSRRLGDDYGYAGPASRLPWSGGQRDTGLSYGSFPPLEGQGRAGRNELGSGIEFEGRYYGAFPPLERRPAPQDRLQEGNGTGVDTEDRGERAFVPEENPSSLGRDPSLGASYPPFGYGAPSRSGTGLYGLPYDPLTMWMLGPGTLW